MFVRNSPDPAIAWSDREHCFLDGTDVSVQFSWSVFFFSCFGAAAASRPRETVGLLSREKSLPPLGMVEVYPTGKSVGMFFLWISSAACLVRKIIREALVPVPCSYFFSRPLSA